MNSVLDPSKEEWWVVGLRARAAGRRNPAIVYLILLCIWVASFLAAAIVTTIWNSNEIAFLLVIILSSEGLGSVGYLTLTKGLKQGEKLYDAALDLIDVASRIKPESEHGLSERAIDYRPTLISDYNGLGTLRPEQAGSETPLRKFARVLAATFSNPPEEPS